MTDVLAIEQLDVEIDGNHILKGIDLTLSTGEILGLVGASGCGKTTLLNTIAGFIPLSAGHLCLAESLHISPSDSIPCEHRKVGMIFQDYALFPHLTVEQNVAFGLAKQTKSDQQKKVSQLLSLLELNDFADRYPHQLSGGQQQRVAIARALAPEPKLLLLDEPFSNIDARLRHELMLEIRQLLKTLNMSAIFVTHNKDEVFTFADKMAVMNAGHLLQVGEPASLCQSPNSWLVADFLQLGSWIPCQLIEDEVHTELGRFPIKNELMANQTTEIGRLLVKPQFISIVEDHEPNAVVSHIGVTEQGFHYHLDSLSATTDLSFKQLSLYSDSVYQLGQHVKVILKEHPLLIFPR